jgi:mono/diheme cytochrome c family protein
MKRAIVAVAVAAAIGVGAYWWFGRGLHAIDPADPAQVARGQALYGTHCARCHGANLEGEPNWQTRKPSGRLPAPPHDASGHTWHHPDAQLFGMVKNGIVPYAPPGYESDMPAFGSTLSDADISAVLAYIKSTWPAEIRDRQRDISERSE